MDYKVQIVKDKILYVVKKNAHALYLVSMKVPFKKISP
jgi:hypothetical protein